VKLLAGLLVPTLVAAGCRATEQAGQPGNPDGSPPPTEGSVAPLFDDVYRQLATLRLLVEDGPEATGQRRDAASYYSDCEMAGGCNLEAFRMFYANLPEGASLAYQQARRACVAALEPEGTSGAQREALAAVCGELPAMVKTTGLFEVDVAALDAAIARLAAVAN
jgi:hypothetical protein